MANAFDPNIGASTRWKKGAASPNPGGRPKSAVLSAALRTKLSQTKPDDPEGRTYAEIIACNLVELASSQSRNSVAAACEILNRCEGKVTQGLTIADVTSEVQSKSDDELAFYLQNGRWPESDLNSCYSADGGEAKRALTVICSSSTWSGREGGKAPRLTHLAISDKRFDVKRIESSRNLSANALASVMDLGHIIFVVGQTH